MILSEYVESNRQANVCNQGGQWVVMCYENSQYLKSYTALTESLAETIAEDWIHVESI